MSLLAENYTDKLKFDDLLKNGLNGAPQGALVVKEPLFSYLQHSFQE